MSHLEWKPEDSCGGKSRSREDGGGCDKVEPILHLGKIKMIV